MRVGATLSRTRSNIIKITGKYRVGAKGKVLETLSLYHWKIDSAKNPTDLGLNSGVNPVGGKRMPCRQGGIHEICIGTPHVFHSQKKREEEMECIWIKYIWITIAPHVEEGDREKSKGDTSFKGAKEIRNTLYKEIAFVRERSQSGPGLEKRAKRGFNTRRIMRGRESIKSLRYLILKRVSGLRRRRPGETMRGRVVHYRTDNETLPLHTGLHYSVGNTESHAPEMFPMLVTTGTDGFPKRGARNRGWRNHKTLPRRRRAHRIRGGRRRTREGARRFDRGRWGSDSL
jgi:hypothetical protein